MYELAGVHEKLDVVCQEGADSDVTQRGLTSLKNYFSYSRSPQPDDFLGVMSRYKFMFHNLGEIMLIGDIAIVDPQSDKKAIHLDYVKGQLVSPGLVLPSMVSGNFVDGAIRMAGISACSSGYYGDETINFSLNRIIETDISFLLTDRIANTDFDPTDSPANFAKHDISRDADYAVYLSERYGLSQGIFANSTAVGRAEEYISSHKLGLTSQAA